MKINSLNKIKFLPLIALIIAAIFGGLNGVFAKFVLKSFSPFAFTTIRYIVVFTILIPIMASQKKLKIRREDLPLFLLVSLFWAGNQFLFLYAVKTTTAIMSQVMYFLSPLLILVLSRFLYKQTFTAVQIFGVLLGMIGGAIFVFKSFSDTSLISLQSFGSIEGNSLLLLAVLSWSLYLTFSKIITKKYSPLALTAYSGIFPFLIALILLIPEIQNGIFPPKMIFLESMIGLIGLIFGGSIIMVFLYQWGIKYTSPFIASSMVYISPISGAFAAIPILGERVTFELLLSTLIVGLGVYFATIHPLVKEYYLKLK